MINPLEYKLEKYRGNKSRFTCPHCHKKNEFTRYIHPITEQRLPHNVGICNRRDKCGYFYSNWDYFKENPSKYFNKTVQHNITKINHTPSYIDQNLVRISMKHYKNNNLYSFLLCLFNQEQAINTMKRYYIGTSKKWYGASIYWQIDHNNKVRTGKIMLYNTKTGKRVHKKQTWVHSILNLEKFNLSQCLFGEHLINTENNSKDIAIVESEKTAIIASNYISNITWLATGGLELLNPVTHPEKFKCLIGKNVILYPDLSLPNKFNGDTAFDNWSRKAFALKKLGINVNVSELLEKNAADKERNSGFDIADYFIQEHINQSYSNH